MGQIIRIDMYIFSKQLYDRYDFVDYYASANMWQKANSWNIVQTRQKMHSGAYSISPWSWPLIFCPQNVIISPSVTKVWSNSVNKYPRYLANDVCLGFRHAQMHEHSSNIMPSATTLAEAQKHADGVPTERGSVILRRDNVSTWSVVGGKVRHVEVRQSVVDETVQCSRAAVVPHVHQPFRKPWCKCYDERLNTS